jgi:hypothetical protein
MKKKDKIAFIIDTNTYFAYAKNHGSNGSNWWNATPNVIAYDVKMSNFPSVEEFRDILTPLQNEKLSDDFISESMQNELYDTANQLVDDIEETFNLKSGFAGRSGGWIEVTFPNNLPDEDELNECNAEELNEYYNEAKTMLQLESDVMDNIEKQHNSYNKYVSSKEYYTDLKDLFMINEYIKEDIELLHDKKLATTLGELLIHSKETVRRHAKGIEKLL